MAKNPSGQPYSIPSEISCSVGINFKSASSRSPESGSCSLVNPVAKNM